MSEWIKCDDQMPPHGIEVLACINGHRGPAWSNTYSLVVYLNGYDNKWYEERHDKEEVVGVAYWQYIIHPEA